MKPALPPYSAWEWRTLAAIGWAMALVSIFTWWFGTFPFGIILAAVILTVIAWRTSRKEKRRGN